MDYGRLFSRAWDIIWEHKFLILLGVLVALGSAGGSGAGQRGATGIHDGGPSGMPNFDLNVQRPLQDIGVPAIALVGGMILLGAALVIGLGLWVISTISRGGLIYGADTVAGGDVTNFSASFRAGWQKAWRLIGIGLFPAVPGFLLFFVGMFSFGQYRWIEALTGGDVAETVPAMVRFVPNIALLCILALAVLLFTLLRSFANRACMLEDLGVIASYRRGFEVLGANLGPAMILFLLQVALSVVIGLALLLPGILIALCCFLWPLLLLIQGTVAAFYSTLWTLAWNLWTGKEDMLQVGTTAAS